MSVKDDVFWGDLERRRPTKRLTTKRSFTVVRNWPNQDSARKPEEGRDSKEGEIEKSLESTARDNTVPSSQPISSQEVVVPSNNNNDDGISPLKTPEISQPSLGTSLPGAASVTPLNKAKKTKETTPKSLRYVESNTLKRGDENENHDMLVVQEETPKKNVLTPQVGLNSGPSQPAAKKTRKRATVAFKVQQKNKDVNIDENQYEAHSFVRLFNADRGRKRSSNEVTDLDVILTNVEEIALELKNEVDSQLCKKLIKETFIQFRQTFSNAIDVYKDKKNLQSANTKANSKLKNMKQELMKLQAKRRRLGTKVEKLQSEYEELGKQKQEKEDAYSFLNEFEALQEKLRTHDIARNAQAQPSDDSLPSLLSEACGYLTTHRELEDINNKLQCWVKKHSNS